MDKVELRGEGSDKGRRLEGEALPSETEVFEKLRELTRNGYLPDASAQPEAGILLRHANAPDLILLPDGGIELPLGQATKPAAPAARPRMWKLRTLTILLLAVGLWFLSLAITATFLEGV